VQLKDTKALIAILLQILWVAGCNSGPAASSGTTTTTSPNVVATTVTATANPLVAQYTITPPAGASVTVNFGPTTNYGQSTATRSASNPGGPVTILVAGMRANTAYHMRATMVLADGTQQFDSDHTFLTGAPPASRIPNVTVTQPAGMTPNSGIELLDNAAFGSGPVPLTAPYTAAAFDLQGNLIWYIDLPDPDGTQLDYPFPIKLLPNGNFLMVVAGGSNSVREVDLAGNIITQFSLVDVQQALAAAGSSLPPPASFHHDILPLANGHLLLLTNATKNFTNLPGFPGVTPVIGDAIIDLDPSGKPVWTWSTFDHVDINHQPLGFPDWTHSNALIYSPGDGNLILSMRDQDWVIKIRYQDGAGDGTILWHLGPGGDFTIPNGTTADYNYAQHYPVLIGPSNFGVFPLMLFDNGNNRIINGAVCGTPGAAECYSRPVIFQLDENAKTAQIQWQYKLPVLSACCGSINVLGNGDAEYDIALFSESPLGSRIQEVTMDPTNPQLVWQMDLHGQLAYRGFRMPSLYPGVQW
jgi:arylsulfate sulfotransferase